MEVGAKCNEGAINMGAISMGFFQGGRLGYVFWGGAKFDEGARNMSFFQGDRLG